MEKVGKGRRGYGEGREGKKKVWRREGREEEGKEKVGKGRGRYGINGRLTRKEVKESVR